MRWLLALLLFAVAPGDSAAALDEPVPVEVRAGTSPFAMSAASGLAEHPLIRLVAEGFAADTTGTIRQCDMARRHCTNELPVRFDQHGEADVLYLFRSEVCGAERCLLEVLDGQTSGFVETVPGPSAAPALELRVDPTRSIRAGQRLVLTVPGPPAGARGDLEAQLCPASLDPLTRCTRLADVSSGRAETTLTPGDVARCQADGCRVALFVDDQPVRSRTVLLDVVRGSAVDYDRRRVAAGTAAALVLLALAAALVRRTDWRPPSQAASAELDDAAYADLDAEAAAFVDR